MRCHAASVRDGIFLTIKHLEVNQLVSGELVPLLWLLVLSVDSTAVLSGKMKNETTLEKEGPDFSR